MTVETERGEIEARAKVTRRLRPLQIDDRTIHQICLPVALGHYTTSSLGVTGDSANDLVALSGDPNVSIEDKTFALPGARRAAARARRRSGSRAQRGPT